MSEARPHIPDIGVKPSGRVIEHGGYEAGVLFYTRKLEEIAEKFNEVDDPDSFEGISLIEQAEDYELKLRQIERRKLVGLL
jgi:hypothetical protein